MERIIFSLEKGNFAKNFDDFFVWIDGFDENHYPRGAFLCRKRG